MAPADRILILRLSALGDVIHTLPAVEMLRAGHPASRIAWAVEPAYAELVRQAAPVDEVILVATRRWRRSLLARETRRELGATIRRLRQEAAGGLAVDFQGLAKSAVIGRLSRRAEQITFPPHLVRERVARWLATGEATVDGTRHVVDQNRMLARTAGGEGEGSFAGLRRFAEQEGPAPEPLRRRIVFNPGAGRADKIWPPDRFAALGRRLQAEGQPPPLIVWGPGERELAAAAAADGSGELAPATNLRQLAAILLDARVLVAGDTGPLHLAAGLDCPVVALFGPTDPERNGPYGQLESCVRGDGSMDDISMDEVAAFTEAVLSGPREANRSE